MAYIVTIGEKTFKVDIKDINTKSGESSFHLTLDGKPLEATVVEVNNPFHLSLILNNRSYEVVKGEGVVAIDGELYYVKVEDEIASRFAKTRGGGAEEKTEITAPMPGLVVAVETKVGERVVAGEGVIILEAMKMQNELKAPRDGIVKKIPVKEGMTVNGGDTLLTLE